MPSQYGPIAINPVTGALTYASTITSDIGAATTDHDASHALGGADAVRLKNFKFVRRVSGDITLTSVTLANVDTGLDLTIPAATGDVIEVSMCALTGNQAITTYFDVATIVGGSPVTYFSSATGTEAGNSINGWLCAPSVFCNIGAPVHLTLVGGDISSGNVTLRLRYRTDGNRTLFAGSDTPFSWSAKNLGSPAA